MRQTLAVLVAAALTGLMMMLIAGHGPWSGSTLWKLSDSHGLNKGDLPVLGLWLLGMGGTVLLARRE